jgi:hypothetical protein
VLPPENNGIAAPQAGIEQNIAGDALSRSKLPAGAEALNVSIAPFWEPIRFLSGNLHAIRCVRSSASAVVLRVSEAHYLGDLDRYKFYEHTKTLIAAPPDVLRCDEKNLREHSVPNLTGVVILTNHKSDGIFLPPDDRRHFVAWSDAQRTDFTPEFWTDLYRWYDSEGRPHVAACLMSLDLSSFNPKAPPPQTAAFWEIVDASRPTEDGELSDLLEALGNPAAITLEMLTREAVGSEILDWLKDHENRRVIGFRLEKCGYTAIRNDAAQDGLWKIGGKRQAVYARQDLAARERGAAAAKLTR